MRLRMASGGPSNATSTSKLGPGRGREDTGRPGAIRKYATYFTAFAETLFATVDLGCYTQDAQLTRLPSANLAIS